MCGIAGIAGARANPAPRVEAMLDRLHHRGPDDRGVHLDDSHGLALCAARLAIRDLSPRGHQPMAGPTGSVIAFNGELYNAGALRAQLEPAGRAFAGESDTEVALAAYEHWGAGAWAHLEGMFALAVWDPREALLWLVRDPLGIKPLYTQFVDGELLFSSELRSLLAGCRASPTLDTAALRSFLATGAVEEPRTMVTGVEMLAPGTAARLQDGSLTRTTFWSVEEAFMRADPIPREEAVRAVRESLELAVRSQLVSDVPLGVFLSGGIDSSALVGLAAGGQEVPKTISVVFPEEQYSEAPYIDAVRRRFATEHHEVELAARDVLAWLPAAVGAMDQPTFDGVNTYVVSRLARQAGLTVALSGLGGDELFAGYELFRTIPRLERLRKRLPRLPRAAAALAARGRYGRGDRARKLSAWLAGEVSSAYVLQREVLDRPTRDRLLGGSPNGSPGRAVDVNAISRLELTHYMRNVLLRDADVMSMAHSLEVRVPLLDQRLVELIGRIPGEYKVAPGREKPLLVDAVADLLPPEVIDRPKMGFTLPFEDWLRGPLHGEVRDRLLDRSYGGGVAEALDGDAVAAVWERFERGATSWSRPWAVYVVKAWGARHLG